MTGKLKERVFTLEADVETFWEQADSPAIAAATNLVTQAAQVVDPLLAERLRRLGPHGPDTKLELAKALEAIRTASEELWRRTASELVQRHLPRLDAAQWGGVMPPSGFLIDAPSSTATSFGGPNGHGHEGLIGSRLACQECYSSFGALYGYAGPATETEALKGMVRDLQQNDRMPIEAAIDRAFAAISVSSATLQLLAKEGLAAILTVEGPHRL